MLTERHIKALAEKYREENPNWREGAYEEAAQRLAETLHPTVERAVAVWLDTGELPSLDTEEFSISMFMTLRKCNFLEALECVNSCYLEPEKTDRIIAACFRR